jgi:hypothetical protein
MRNAYNEADMMQVKRNEDFKIEECGLKIKIRKK